MVGKGITAFNVEDGNEEHMSPSIEASKASLSKLRALCSSAKAMQQCSISGHYCITESHKDKGVSLPYTQSDLGRLDKIWGCLL